MNAHDLYGKGMLNEDAETGCCRRFYPDPWDKKFITWKGKLFVHDRVISFMHIPLNFGQVVVRNILKIQRAGAVTPEPLMLSDENSRWGADIYIAVTKKVPDADMVKLSGTFLTLVFEGSFTHIGSWMKEMQEFVLAKNKTLQKVYFFYTTCPACAKHYGKNYVVLVARV